MKVIAINGAARKNGNTTALLKAALRAPPQSEPKQKW
jgi:multimeric flavodoxin WrbA